MRRGWILAGVVATLVLAGCSTSSHPATGSTAPAIQGLGATRAAFTSRFPANGSGNGPTVDGSPQLEGVQYANGLVIAFVYELSPGTTLAVAQAAVRQLIPSDAVVSVELTPVTGSGGSACATESWRSAALGRLLASPKIDDANGDLSVTLTSFDDASHVSAYDPANIRLASFSIASADLTAGC